MIRKSTSPEKVVSLLNNLLELDRPAITNLIFSRVECNKKVEDHPEVRTGIIDKKYYVGLMGILNGLFGVNLYDQGCIYFVLNEVDKNIDRFEVNYKYKPESK